MLVHLLPLASIAIPISTVVNTTNQKRNKKHTRLIYRIFVRDTKLIDK